MRYQLIASHPCPDEGWGSDLQPRQVPLTSNRTRILGALAEALASEPHLPGRKDAPYVKIAPRTIQACCLVSSVPDSLPHVRTGGGGETPGTAQHRRPGASPGSCQSAF